jgi:hypothetical protein
LNDRIWRIRDLEPLSAPGLLPAVRAETDKRQKSPFHASAYTASPTTRYSASATVPDKIVCNTHGKDNQEYANTNNVHFHRQKRSAHSANDK